MAGENMLTFTLFKGQFGFGVNVSDVAVVLDTRKYAEEAGIRKGHIISAINGTAVGTKQEVQDALKASKGEAHFCVHVPLMLEIRRKSKESLTVSLKPGHKMHWAFTLQGGTINYCAKMNGREVCPHTAQPRSRSVCCPRMLEFRALSSMQRSAALMAV